MLGNSREMNQPDPALDPGHQHTHGHLHHAAGAYHEGNDQPVYSTGTTKERSTIPDPSPQDHDRIQHHHHHQTDKKLETNIADVEKGNLDSITPTSSLENSPERSGKGKNFYRRYRNYFHLAFWMVATGWWTAGLGLHYNDMNWVVPFLLWLAITIRIITLHVSISYVTRPMHWVWNNTGVRVNNAIPERLRLYCGAAVTVAVILVATFVSKEETDNTRENRAISLFGLLVLVFGLWATSRNRKAINWHTVISGMLIQYIVALFVLRTSVGYDIFNFVSELARELLGFAGDGVIFLTDKDVPKLGWFLISVLPAIIFFVSLVQMLYYWGTIQWFIGKFAVFFFWAMRVSGAEAVVAAASPFIGQGESAMLIKPFVAHLTMAELHQIMCSGFATIAGSVLVAYIGLGE